MRKVLLITSCAAAISAFATVGALAQSGAATAPTAAQSAQTPSTKPMTNDASKSGSPAATGAMQKDGTTGMSNDKMSNDKMMSKDKMKKDNMSK